MMQASGWAHEVDFMVDGSRMLTLTWSCCGMERPDVQRRSALSQIGKQVHVHCGAIGLEGALVGALGVGAAHFGGNSKFFISYWLVFAC
jgi:hypothetical protein